MELATLNDLQQMKSEIIEELKKLFENKIPKQKKWVKSKEARELLKCSPGTLQNLRQTRQIEFTRIGGTIYYNIDSIIRRLEQNKQN